MKKILFSALCAAGMLMMVSCSDYLETSSPSVVDADFVFSNSTTARAALEGGYEQWRATANSYVFGAGLFYAADIAGSDIERHPEAYSNQIPRHVPETFFENGVKASTYDIDSYDFKNNNSAYAYLYSCIGKANSVIDAMEKSESFEAAVTNAKEPSAISELYGEAVALRAVAYRELIKYYGDVPFVEHFGTSASGLTCRDSIYDVLLAQLKKVEPLMYPVGSIPGVAATAKNYFSQTFVDCLIGRMSLEAAGFQTRRADINYVNGKGEAITFEKKGQPNANAGNCVYERRSDWKSLYEDAKTYFGYVYSGAHAGTAKFLSVDPRSTGSKGQIFNNPYQYFFQEMMNDDNGYATESIYEYPMTQNVASDERTYSSGRPATGGSNGYPTKCYGQCRLVPAYIWGVFDPNDMRRDVTCAYTGSNAGIEVLLSFTPNSQAKGGGLGLNKFDDNRMAKPLTTAQRKSGINGPYMRISEAILGYAEACAGLGNDSEARTALLKIRSRAFGSDAAANVDAFISKCSSLYPNSGWSATYKAVIEERGFEFAGEGDRRYTLIRTGILPEAVKRIKNMTLAMINGLSADGYYTFENGNTICANIYTKTVDAKADKGYRLTTQCTDNTDPVLFPGWRGQNDDWAAFGWTGTATATNLAIRGLFDKVSEAEATELVNAGFKKTAYGSVLVDKKAEYYDYFFTDYDYVSAPVHLWPIGPNAVSTGGFENGYGFMNE